MSESSGLPREIIGDLGLPKGLDAETFVEQIVAQVIKDFRLDPERVGRASISFVELLTDEIAEGLSGERADEVFASFYRLDLGEQLIRSTLEANDRRTAARELAMQSVRRAGLKVWSRWKYKTEGC
jgi:hypothetical protein